MQAVAGNLLGNPFVPAESYRKYTHKDEKRTRLGLGPSAGLRLTAARLLSVSFPSGFLQQMAAKIDAAALILWEQSEKRALIIGTPALDAKGPQSNGG